MLIDAEICSPRFPPEMLAMTKSEVADRAEKFVASLSIATTSALTASLVKANRPLVEAPVLHLNPHDINCVGASAAVADEIEGRLRAFEPPIISRVSEGSVLDLRTVALTEELIFAMQSPDLATKPEI